MRDRVLWDIYMKYDDEIMNKPEADISCIRRSRRSIGNYRSGRIRTLQLVSSLVLYQICIDIAPLRPLVIGSRSSSCLTQGEPANLPRPADGPSDRFLD